jgi:hypothetical protein
MIKRLTTQDQKRAESLYPSQTKQISEITVNATEVEEHITMILRKIHREDTTVLNLNAYSADKAASRHISWGCMQCGGRAEYLHSTHEALGLIPSTLTQPSLPTKPHKVNWKGKQSSTMAAVDLSTPHQ